MKYKTRERKGYERGTARNFLHSFPLSGAPVVQSYWAHWRFWGFVSRRLPPTNPVRNLCLEAWQHPSRPEGGGGLSKGGAGSVGNRGRNKFLSGRGTQEIRLWANGVVCKWGRTDVTGFSPDFPFSALSGYALHLWKHTISSDFDRILTAF